MRIALFALAPACLSAQVPRVTPSAPIREFRVEAAHSDVAFSIGFLGFPVRGRFDDVRGTIAYVDGNPAASSITVAIGTKSLNTGSAHRDEHLRSSDFFDVEKFPVILFSSRSVARNAGGWVVRGPLTMHGVTRDIAIPFREVGAPIKDPHGSTLVLFSGTVRLNRKDFGILGGSRFNPWFDDLRRATMADSVDVTLNVQGWDTDYDRVDRHARAIARVQREGADSVVASLRRMRAQNPDTLRNAEWEFRELARALVSAGRLDDAVKLARFSAEAFANSAAAQSDLARALELAGDRVGALQAVQRALSVDAYDTHALEIRRRLL